MHSDARTNAPDTDYFFLGDSRMTVAIQRSRNPALSPYGLLLWTPDRFARKESTLLFHPEFGLDRTMLTVTVDGVRHRPRHEDVRVRWSLTEPSEALVTVEWNAGEIRVTELFGMQGMRYAPLDAGWNDDFAEENQIETYLVREVRLDGTGSSRKDPHDCGVELAFYPNPYVLESYPAELIDYNRLVALGDQVHCLVGADSDAILFERFLTVRREHVTGTATPMFFSYGTDVDEDPPVCVSFPVRTDRDVVSDGDELAERMFRQYDIARTGLNAVVGGTGRFDASVWQYGYEWGQDAAMVASAAVYAGEFELAEAVMMRIMEGLSNDEGRIAESSRFRDGELAELNANGAVLLALRDYVALTGDTAPIERYHDRIRAIADLPLRDEYLHPSGLILGRRDLWERLPWMGLKTGFDTATNVFCSEGLIAAAELARLIGDGRDEARWFNAGERIRSAMLNDRTFGCIEEGRVIHRRLPDGSVQREMIPEAGYHDERYAPYVPTSVSDTTPRPCDPDSTAALPILYGIVDPASDVARRTLDHLREHLWNTTGIGGYARSPISSDPDSPGPWVFPTAWIAEAELRAGLMDRGRETTEWLLAKAGAGGSWFEYHGERESPPFPPVGVIPWAWAQYLLLVVRGWMGIEFDTERLRIAPRMTGFEHELRVGEQTVSITVNGLTRAIVNGNTVKLTSEGMDIALPIDRDYHVIFST